MLLLTKEELKSYQEANLCYICGKGILKKFAKDKNYWKVRDHFIAIIQVYIEVQHISLPL